VSRDHRSVGLQNAYTLAAMNAFFVLRLSEAASRQHRGKSNCWSQCRSAHSRINRTRSDTVDAELELALPGNVPYASPYLERGTEMSKGDEMSEGAVNGRLGQRLGRVR
jgi:hypothetical protein